MAVTPPENRLWWSEPVEPTELAWVFIALLWGLFMFFFMVGWHFFGNQNLNKEAYRIIPSSYEDKVNAYVEKNKVGEEDGIPVVKPTAGSDVYLLARRWQWWPILQLEKGQKYRFHISSVDWMHGFSLQPIDLNLEVHPGYEHIVTMTPTIAGDYGIVCNEFCGIGHHTMTGRIHVTEQKQADAGAALAGGK